MRTYTAYDTVHALALEQHGVFTVEQARAAGVTAPALFEMVKRERLQKLAYGLYRDPAVPETRLTPYTTAVLWPNMSVTVAWTCVVVFVMSPVRAPGHVGCR